MHRTILIMVLSLACCCGAFAKDLDMSKFAGLWEVNFDATMEEAKKSPKYDEKMAERLPDMVKRLMAVMKVRLNDEEMVYLRGTREMAIPYRFKSSDDKSVTVSMTQGPSEATTVVFTLIGGKHMNFKSSASDDMHYYVWQKSTVEKKEETK